eukprot:scaffold568749_cov33-Prasinocladus_malaysianus.AAC.1
MNCRIHITYFSFEYIQAATRTRTRTHTFASTRKDEQSYHTSLTLAWLSAEKRQFVLVDMFSAVLGTSTSLHVPQLGKLP